MLGHAHRPLRSSVQALGTQGHYSAGAVCVPCSPLQPRRGEARNASRLNRRGFVLFRCVDYISPEQARPDGRFSVAQAYRTADRGIALLNLCNQLPARHQKPQRYGIPLTMPMLLPPIDTLSSCVSCHLPCKTLREPCPARGGGPSACCVILIVRPGFSFPLSVDVAAVHPNPNRILLLPSVVEKVRPVQNTRPATQCTAAAAGPCGMLACTVRTWSRGCCVVAGLPGGKA
ncbi:hypothetical protein IWX46DRAFT_599929 [Phyllosticta citricarpa]|uniref:Uncharacterized protein n=1 Tax=Phyllosticta citricarpa TaxID=55181 RepID=A0ABR1MD25_9PEZI